MIVTIYLAVFFQHYLDIMLIAAAWSIAYARLNMDNKILYKVGTLMSQALWFIYSMMFADYAMVITTSLIFFSNSAGLFRIITEERGVSFGYRFNYAAPVIFAVNKINLLKAK